MSKEEKGQYEHISPFLPKGTWLMLKTVAKLSWLAGWLLFQNNAHIPANELLAIYTFF